MNKKILGFTLIILSATAFGFMPIFASYAYKSGLQIESILLFRFTIAAVLLNMYILLKGYSYPKGIVLAKLFFMGAVLYSAQAFSLFSAIDRIGTSLTSILLYLYPTIVLLLSIFLLKIKIKTDDIFALLLTSIGAMMVVGLKIQDIDTLGIVFGVSAAVFYSVYILLGDNAMKGLDPILGSTVVISGAAFTYLAYGAYVGITLPTNTDQWTWTVAIAVISTIVSIVAFFSAQQIIGSIKASMISTFELVVTLMFSFILLHEHMGALQLMGSVSILLAAVILARESNE
ncbi:MAG: DMT family transporter [Campylobacterota bacterium]|nr:DMT family transporter [Campylobacterota bacterium]